MAMARASRSHAMWLRVDLRMDDNPALLAACEKASSLLPIFVFDPAKFKSPTLAGSIKSSARRARFLLESVSCMRKKLESKGSGLAVVLGDAGDVIPKLAASAQCSEVFVTQGVCSEETREEARVAKALSGAVLTKKWGGTLYFPEDCGCNPKDVPLMFTSFKNRAEGRGCIRAPLNPPGAVPPLPQQDKLKEHLQFLPSLEDLGYTPEEARAAREDDPRGVLPFKGGEDAALERVQNWMFRDDQLKNYFDIRNGMVGEGYSSKLSPWLALGCISPRRVWMDVGRYEKERVQNKSTYWLIFELTWRDFFVYMGYSVGDKLFLPGGVTGQRQRWSGGEAALRSWKEGRTGDKLVDANMKELAATGFMSNRGRQNVASYLIFDLGVDWRYGAAHFEEHLLDYDPCSNWGNWVAAAGLTGQRVNKFNTKKQLNDYDPKREYVGLWLQGASEQKPRSRSPEGARREKVADEWQSEKPKGKGKGKGKKGDTNSNGGGYGGRDDRKNRRWVKSSGSPEYELRA